MAKLGRSPPWKDRSSRLRALAEGARTQWGLWIAAAAGLAAYGGFVRLDASGGTLGESLTPQTIGWYLLAFAGFLLALWWNERRPVPLVWLWVIPIVFRLLLLITTPTLSDDVYRYLWDGNVATAGVNPYAYALDAPELDSLHISARELANNPSLGSPYLPVAQVTFAATASVAPSEPLALQTVMVGFDLAAAVVIVGLLRMAALPMRRVMLYLWNPLVVVEAAHGAHLDALMVFLALLAVYLTLLQPASRAKWAAPVILALATLTKPLPLLLLPVLWPRWGRSQRLVYGTTVAAVLVPFGLTAGWGLVGGSDGTGLFGSARVYSGWTFNSGAYHWLAGWLERWGVADPAGVARFIVATLMVSVLVAVWALARQRGSPRDTLRLMALALMAYALLTPTFHPWYLVIVVAFLPFLGSYNWSWSWLQVAPWLYLSAAVFLSYLTYLDPLNHGEIEWVRKVEWYPTLILLALAGVTRYLRDRDVRKRDPAPQGLAGRMLIAQSAKAS